MTHPDTSKTGSNESFAAVQDAYDNYKRSGGWVPVFKRTTSYNASYDANMKDFDENYHDEAARWRERSNGKKDGPHSSRPPFMPKEARILVGGVFAVYGAFQLTEYLKPPLEVRVQN